MYCSVLDALGRRLVRIGKLTRTRGTGIVYWRHQRAQWEWAPTRFWLWLDKYSNYVMKHYLMNSNIFCLGFPFLQLGRKKKHEKRCEIGKSVLRLHVLMVRISSSLCEKKRNGDIFLISETSMLTRSCGYLQRHLLGCHPWRNCKWTSHKNVMNNRLELS